MTTYTAEDIQQLEGLEAIRRRPGMYIGPTDSQALLHLLKEVVANSIDECLAGHADRIMVTLHRDGSAAVADNGRGIPIEWKADVGMSALTQVFTQLHAGGKFSDTAYNVAGGLHGVGLKAVSALSDRLMVEVRRSGVTIRQTFKDGGRPETGVEIIDAAGQVAGEVNGETALIHSKGLLTGLEPGGRRKKRLKPDQKLGTGTLIRFRPWRTYFDRNLKATWKSPAQVPWPVKQLDRWLTQLAFLYPGLRLLFEDKRRGERKEYQADGGLAGYVAYLNEGLKALHQPITLAGEATVEVELNGAQGSRTLKVQAAIQYVSGAEEASQLYAFTNGIFNPDGGSHVSGFQSALTRVLKTTAAGLRGLKGAADISGNDILPGLTAAIAITMPWEPKFEGQTKRKLLSAEIQGPVNSVVYQELQAFFGRSKNSKIARSIIQQALAAAHGRKAAARARQLVNGRGVADAARSGILGKLVPVAGGRNKVAREQRELYLVEGDSAGGTAKLGRDPTRQAILPLRGKPLNVEGRRLSKILDNREFRTIIAAIGADVGRNFNLEQMEYGRVVILADADPDGGHITALLLTFFFRQMRPLIEAGCLAVAIPPLYKVENGQGARYCYSEGERDEAVAHFGQAAVKRFKGLGEMNDVELKEAIFDNPTGLRRVTIEDTYGEAGQCVANLMGNNAAFRQAWLEELLKQQLAGGYSPRSIVNDT